ncbi:MAG: hypothetical protein B7Z37_15275 [Verrucomicrobia bacterium 12-59-8]|nr:MAG: hypothetical protein B7Z37_15275 [Verrucomicrobia bacterium 12-59-8]
MITSAPMNSLCMRTTKFQHLLQKPMRADDEIFAASKTADVLSPFPAFTARSPQLMENAIAPPTLKVGKQITYMSSRTFRREG